MERSPWQVSLFSQLERELEAATDDEAASRLCYQLALLCWNLEGDVAGAERWLRRAQPGFVRGQLLLSQICLSRGEPGLAVEALDRAAEAVTPDEAIPRSWIRGEAALLCLLWSGDPLGALREVRNARADTPTAGELEQLELLALSVTGDAQGLAELGEAASAGLPVLVAAGEALWDRLGAPERAAALLVRALDQDEENPYLLELLLEIAASSFDDAQLRYLERKLRLQHQHGAGSPEAAGTALLVARALTRQGRLEEATALLERLESREAERAPTPSAAASPMAWGRMVVLLTRQEIAARSGDRVALARIDLELGAACQISAFVRAYQLRAAQLLQCGSVEAAEVEELLVSAFKANPADPQVAYALESFRLRQGRLAALCAEYEERARHCPQKGALLRRAALVAEAHCQDLQLATSLRRDGLLIAPDPGGFGDFRRLCRMSGNDGQLLEAYLREIDSCSDQDQLAVLWNAVATLRLQRELVGEAAEAVREARCTSPGDPLALSLLIWIHRATANVAALKEALTASVTVFVSPLNRAESLRHLAGMSADAQEARELLEQALALSPDDVALLSELATRLEREGDFAGALRRWSQVADALSEEPRRFTAEIFLRIGNLHLHHLGDPGAALAALQLALEGLPGSREILHEVARACRELGEEDRLLDTLDRLIEVETEPAVRRELLQERAQLRELTGEDEGALADLGDVLRLDPARLEVLGDLARICQRARCPGRLLEILSDLPPAVGPLQAVVEALESMDDPEALLVARERLLALLEEPRERAAAHLALASLHERLGRMAAAEEHYRQALAEAPGNLMALRALQRIFRETHRPENLIEVLEKEMDVVGPASERTDALLELAQLYEESRDCERAVACLEEVIQADPTRRSALSALERNLPVTDALGLARVLTLKARAEEGREARCAALLRAGKLLDEQGEEERAGEVLHEAVQVDPGNREAFTTFELFALERGRWEELMALYDGAIRHVEETGGRSFRPVDLFLRRGFLQLNHLNQYEAATASYLAALDRDPKSESVIKAIEGACAQRQDWLGLVRAYEHRAQVAGENELFRLESLRQAARLASGRLPGSPEEALRLWEEILRADPTDEEALESLERLSEAARNHERLVDLLETRLALEPTAERAIPLRLRVAALCENELEDPERAMAALEGVRALEPHHEEALRALARIGEGLGRWDRCLDALQELVLIEGDPQERALLLFKCGSICESRFSSDERAISFYQAALAEARDCLPAIHGLRDIFFRQEEWNKALDTLGLEHDLWEEPREQAGILARMGEIRLRHLADPLSAQQHFERAIAVDPECYPASLALFHLYFERGETASALTCGEVVIPRMAREGEPGERSSFYSRRGQMLAAGGQLAAAAESLVVALEIQPTNLEALDWLIALCRRSPSASDFAAVFRQLEQIYRRGGDQAALGHVLVAAGALAEMAGDAERALSRYQEAVEGAPHDLVPARSQADLLVHLRRPEEASECLLRLVERTSDPSVRIRAMLRVGDIWSNVVVNPTRALEAFQAVLALDPHHGEASERMAQELYGLGRFVEAREAMSALVQHGLKNGLRSRALARFEHYLGVILLQLGAEEEAREQFRRSLQLDPQNASAAQALSRRLAVSGDHEGAVRLLTDTLELVTRGSGAALDLQRSLGALLLGAGRIGEAIEWHERVAREGGRREDRIALAEILGGLPDRGRDAREEVLAVLEEAPLDHQSLVCLAGILEAQGEDDGLRRTLQVLRESGWIEDELRRKLAFLEADPVPALTSAADQELRGTLAGEASPGFLSSLWAEVRDPLEDLFALEPRHRLGVGLEEIAQGETVQLVEWSGRLLGLAPRVTVSENLSAMALATREGELLLDQRLLALPQPEQTFILIRTMEQLRSGHALLSRLGPEERQLLGDLLDGLLVPGERGELQREFYRGLPRRMVRRIDALASAYQDHLERGGEENLPAEWMAGLDRLADRVGLLVGDDIGAALRAMAGQQGREELITAQGHVLAGLLEGGTDLVRFFLSAGYAALRRRLLAP